MADVGKRVPPSSLEAERAVLGGILLENDAMNVVTEILRPDDFYSQANSIIFDTMMGLVQRSQPIDQVTLRAELASRGKLQAVGGEEYLLSLTDTIPTVHNIESHAKIVREKSVVRKLITACHEIAAKGYGDYGDAAEFLDEAERSVFEAAKERGGTAYEHVQEIVYRAFQKIHEAAKRDEKITGLPTGFEGLDKKTAGMHPGQLIIIAGRPGMGKTAFALNVALNASAHKREQPEPVAVFSLEMAKEELVRRMISSEARVEGGRLRTGQIAREDWTRLAEAAGFLSEMPLYIDDTPAISVLEMRAKARRMRAEHGLSLVVVDYLQLARSGARTDSREQEISEISRSLKALSKELEIPVVALSQLNRGVESRGNKDKRPQLADLRECVTGDTLVVLADGRRVPICELVDTTPEVLAMSERGQVTRARSDKVWRVGRRRVHRVRLASGREIRATAKHRLYGANGWVRVGELAEGSRIARARTISDDVSGAPMASDDGLNPVLANVVGSDVVAGDPDKTREVSRHPVSFVRHLVKTREVSHHPTRFVRDSVKTPEVRSHLPSFVPTGDFAWDRVVEVADDGEEDVYDLTVPGPSCWLADGIVSHNSGAIEQDADTILFIYRDEVYNRDDPSNQGIAEIIIGKQRAGPTGTVRCRFFSEYTRFDDLAEDDYAAPVGDAADFADG